MTRNICVFSSSSDALDASFFALAEELGAEIARRGHGLVYGGTNVGLMGAVARAVQRGGGKVVGVIPRFIADRGLAYEAANELILTLDMRQRKATMEARADAFLALPGGFGTLEEVLEVITLKQLRQHTKPVVFVNPDGYYDPLTSLFEHMYEKRFAKQAYRGMYEFAPDVRSALDYMDHYQPPSLPVKWTAAGS
ncbi:MAG: TIGR00730 family Rossman fold protein [Acidobacteriia bacterium]|nr:TIGR00730 family Rossman fold protein [Terriglobia bacterium]